ncbi:hypothetical protein FJ970_25110 [Mesorhizobium sp. B2-1-8]|nr:MULTISPECIES: hypothetical protein [unclassified Mesorhizobium]MBZ9673178.1 hypothetical protein [Mesorhizobium sp. ES1-3]MBZ9706867.1 hypothetical protein [Mesorhizobium sp. ESP7-2]UCI18337.1 hypothetical protein FJ970_25110 [Mesorhizobium sp. B2-1-8]
MARLLVPHHLTQIAHVDRLSADLALIEMFALVGGLAVVRLAGDRRAKV